MKITAYFQVTLVTLSRQFSSDHTPSAALEGAISVIFHCLTALFYSSSSNISQHSGHPICVRFSQCITSVRLV